MMSLVLLVTNMSVAAADPIPARTFSNQATRLPFTNSLNPIPFGLSESLPTASAKPAADVEPLSPAVATTTQPTTCTPPTGIIISEFRLRGPNGADDEFIELYNTNAAPVMLCTADGSAGWALSSSGGSIKFVIPYNTQIPGYGHYLAAAGAYSLNDSATGDIRYSPAIGDNTGIALFNTTNPANFNSANLLDAVGFSTETDVLYREGAGLSPLGSENAEYSFVRKLNTGFPQDTANNAADFMLISPEPASIVSATATLGSPSPENLVSPIQRNAAVKTSLIDPTVSASLPPNRIRVGSDTGPNSAWGTMTIRRRYTNNTGQSVSRLRFRVTDISTLNSPGYVAGGTQSDMRVLDSADVTVELSNGTSVLVKGTSVETPPAQPKGGGINSSLSTGTITLGSPLASGASVNVQFRLGVQQNGSFRFLLNVEALLETENVNQAPVAHAGGPYAIAIDTPVQFNASNSYDPDGTITSYFWEFGDSSIAQGTTPSHIYQGYGTRTVSLTVTDNSGARSTATTTVTIHGAATPPKDTIDPYSTGGIDVRWNAANRTSADDPDNERGTPPSQPEGNGNFQIAAPVISLPGRGMNLDLNMVYNSRLWNKAGTEMLFDIDHDWPAPGWQLGFGKMVNMGAAGAMLIDADGTRHAFKGDVSYPYNTYPVFKGDTTDGSFIEYRCEMGAQPTGVARFPNGTTIHYANYSRGYFSNAPNNYLYPTLIMDANGNGIQIKYIWNSRGDVRILHIVDTLGRLIFFHYEDSTNLLTAITAQDDKISQGAISARTLVRFNYERKPVITDGFPTLTSRVHNPSPWMLKAIYYPPSSTGYWFGDTDSYSPYGMLRKVVEQRGMSFAATTPLKEQGSITSGVMTKQQEYAYPSEAQNLSNTPTFANVKEIWDAMDGTTPQPATTTFLVEDDTTLNQRVVTVTRPDLTKVVQRAHKFPATLPETDPNKFEDGLVKEEQTFGANGSSLGKVKYSWEPGAGKAPRLKTTETTDERGQVLKVDYDDYDDYNAVGRVREYDYNQTTVLRSTLKTYLTYTDNRLNSTIDISLVEGRTRIAPRVLGLVKTVKIYKGDKADNKLVAYEESNYDNYSTPPLAYVANYDATYDLYIFGSTTHTEPGIINHAANFNPNPGSMTGGTGDNYIKNRGNITSMVRYADLSNPNQPAGAVTETRTYDMAGNVIKTSSTCCEQTGFLYEDANQYAYPSSKTRGSATDAKLQVKTNFTYYFYTGLLRKTTDANGRVTEATYYPESWRPKDILLPAGGRTTFSYDNNLLKTTEASYLSATGSPTGQSVKYVNGLGQVRREEAQGESGVWDVVETTYDKMGRTWKQTRPYRSGETKQWKETLYDDLGRVISLKEPGYNNIEAYNTPASIYYNETERPEGASGDPGQTTRTFDAWGREKWSRLDASGKLVELVEAGISASTKYSYDALGNLSRIEQGEQVRRFRYDALGRLTHQKLAETEATLNNVGEPATNEPEAERWSDVFSYDERSNMITRTDARGVRTSFRYNNDPLNRLQKVEYDTTRVKAAILTVLSAPNVIYNYRVKTSPTELKDVTQLESVATRHAGAAQDENVESYSYFPDGRLQTKTLSLKDRQNYPFETSYDYDNLDRVKEIKYPMQYQSGVTSAARKVVKPSYDTAGRPRGLTVDSADYAAQITYNAASQITSLVGGNGTAQFNEQYSYDAASGLLAGQTVLRGGATLMNLSYGYRKDRECRAAVCTAVVRSRAYTGQLTSVKDNRTGVEHFYAYDSLGRLSSAEKGSMVASSSQSIMIEPEPESDSLSDSAPSGSSTYVRQWEQYYTFDRYGNRLTVASTGNSGGTPVVPDGYGTLSYDTTTNRITTPGFIYDAAGNQTQAGTGQTFIYDAAGRLARVDNQSGVAVVSYTYGASNKRLIAHQGDTNAPGRTVYVWEGDSVFAEYNESSALPSVTQWAKNYIYLGGRLLATQEPNGNGGELVQYHHPDRRGTRLITNNANTSVVEQQTLPFGTALDSESTGVNTTARRFTSYERSAQTGLDYAVNRHYDARQGRFTQVDPIGMSAVSLANPQTLNLYAYCANDPINNVDPNGLFFGAVLGFVGRFFAGLFGGPGGNINVFGSFTYHNLPPISVSFTDNFKNISLGFAGVNFQLKGQQPCSGSIPEAAARIILDVAFQEKVDPTLLSVQWRHEAIPAFNPYTVPNPRWMRVRGRKPVLVGFDVGPMQLATSIWNKSPYTDGLPNVFGTIAMNAKTGEYEGFNGNVYDNLRAGARAFTMDILPRSKGADWLHRNADASGRFRGPAGYTQRYNEYLREAPGDKAQLDCLAGRR